MTKDTDALREALGQAYEKVKEWPERNGDPMEVGGQGFMDLLALRNLIPDALAALATPASDVAPVEYETLIAAGFDEYAAHCALRTEPDGGFCHAYFYSDGQWRFQTGGNDLTLADGTILRCVLTKRLFAHPPLAQSVDPVAGEALRDALVSAACDGIADDYMTSEKHHPGYVLIPSAKFEAILAALKGPAAWLTNRSRMLSCRSGRGT